MIFLFSQIELHKLSIPTSDQGFFYWNGEAKRGIQKAFMVLYGFNLVCPAPLIILVRKSPLPSPHILFLDAPEALINSGWEDGKPHC